MKKNENVVLDNRGNVSWKHYATLANQLYAGRKASQIAKNKPEASHATNIQRRGSK